MHKVASFLSGIILSPVYWIIILVIAGFLFKRKKIKITCWWTAAIVFFIFSNPILINWYASKWQAPRGEIIPGKGYSCGIVLGGFASVDADNYPYFNGAADRFIQALKLYKTGMIRNIMIAGGNGRKDNEGFAEAGFVKNELITMGVPAANIFIEDRSNNTAENAANAKRILDSSGLKPPYLLITSAFHVPRAQLIFTKAGLKVEPFACNFSASNRNFKINMLLPQLGVLNSWDTYLKETFAYWWYKHR